MQAIKLIHPLEFIAAGTVLKRNVNGDYFISRSDEQFLHSPVQFGSNFYISGDYLRAHPELYEILEGTPNMVDLFNDVRHAVLSGAPADITLQRLNTLQQLFRAPPSEGD